MCQATQTITKFATDHNISQLRSRERSRQRLRAFEGILHYTPLQLQMPWTRTCAQFLWKKHRGCRREFGAGDDCQYKATD